MAADEVLAVRADPSVRSGARLHGVDVARGLAVVGMLLVDNRGNDSITPQLTHAPWNGLRVADVVFPVFLLIVGVSMPLSERAQRPATAVGRAARLLLLGWLIVMAKYGWNTPGPGVLGHIAGAYLLCWLLLRLPRPVQAPAAVAVLIGITLLLLVVPVPGTGRTGLSPELSWASWVDGTTTVPVGAEGPHTYLPSAVTVFLGVLAGRVLRSGPAAAPPRLVALGGGLLAAGLALAPVLPLNKHVWTPSYVLVTGGIGLLVLALVHWLVDLRGIRRPVRPVELLGSSAIVVFVVSELLFRALLADRVQPAVVGWLADVTTDGVAACLYPALSVLVAWAVCAALLRRGVVVRV
jgi:predicted acyltransferase